MTVMTPPQAESTEQRIRHLEAANKELLNEFSDDVELALSDVPEDSSTEQKLQILEIINRELTDAVNSQDELPSKPKFGKFDGPIVSIHIKGRPDPVWIDVDGVNIDTNEHVQLTPEVIKKLG